MRIGILERDELENDDRDDDGGGGLPRRINAAAKQFSLGAHVMVALGHSH